MKESKNTDPVSSSDDISSWENEAHCDHIIQWFDSQLFELWITLKGSQMW